MKEFIKSQKVTYNLMSFTGFKSLLIFSILIESPKSFEEIGQIVENNPYLKEKMSTDTMRVYMNSLKYIGCDIKRTKGADKISRYYIDSHPFELKLSDEQLNSIKKVYKTLVKSMDIKDLLYMDNLLEKIGKYIRNEDFINDIRKISMLKEIDKDILKNLIEYCDKKLQISITYQSPKSGDKDISIISDKIEIRNGKIYLYGYGMEYQEDGIFQVNRIKKINTIKINNTVNKLKKFKVVYELYCPSEDTEIALDKDEILIKRQGKNALIEASTSNEFLLRQKLLSLGPQCKIISPQSFRNDYINTLKYMKARYYCEKN